MKLSLFHFDPKAARLVALGAALLVCAIPKLLAAGTVRTASNVQSAADVRHTVGKQKTTNSRVAAQGTTPEAASQAEKPMPLPGQLVDYLDHADACMAFLLQQKSPDSSSELGEAQTKIRSVKSSLNIQGDAVSALFDCKSQQITADIDGATSLISKLPDQTNLNAILDDLTLAKSDLKQFQQDNFETVKPSTSVNRGESVGPDENSIWKKIRLHAASLFTVLCIGAAIVLLAFVLLRRPQSSPDLEPLQTKFANAIRIMDQKAQTSRDEIRSLRELNAKLKGEKAKLQDRIESLEQKQKEPEPQNPYKASAQGYAPDRLAAQQRSDSVRGVMNGYEEIHDPVSDFNCCLSLDLNAAEDLFYHRYSEIMALSCDNLEDHRKPNAVLRFRQSSRGNFLAIAYQSRIVVVPSILGNTKSLEDRFQTLEGVFKYPNESGRLQLRSSAIVTKHDDHYELVQEGAIERV